MTPTCIVIPQLPALISLRLTELEKTFEACRQERCRQCINVSLCPTLAPDHYCIGCWIHVRCRVPCRPSCQACINTSKKWNKSLERKTPQQEQDILLEVNRREREEKKTSLYIARAGEVGQGRVTSITAVADKAGARRTISSREMPPALSFWETGLKFIVNGGLARGHMHTRVCCGQCKGVHRECR